MFDKVKYDNDYNAENYSRLGIVMTKEAKQELIEYAKCRGISVGELVRKAIREYTLIDTRMPTEK